MSFRFTLLALFLLGSSLQLTAQDHEASIRQTFARYRQLTLDKDYSGLMDYIYPKLFTIASREQMVEVFESMEGDDMSISFSDLQLDSISAPFTWEQETFALVGYSGEMKMAMLSPQFQESGFLALMEAQFAGQFGEENVKLDEKKKLFRIQINKSMWAITPAEEGQWTFVDNDAEKEMLTAMLIPAPVREHFQTQE